MSTGRTIHVHDMVQAVRSEFAGSRESHARSEFRTIVAVPLIGRASTLGVLGVLRYEVRPFSGAEIALLETFADQAVIAIENARLFEPLERDDR